MNELITINYDSTNPTVNGRELHAALDVATDYKDWFRRMCDYGFSEGKDFRSFLSESTGGRPGKEHVVTVSMAKELCMLQRSEKGKQFRQYFIAIEEAWNSPDKVMERALKLATERAAEAERRIFALAAENEELAIALNTSLDFWTVAKYNKKFNNRLWTLDDCKSIGRRLSAFCRKNGFKIEKCETNDERFGEANSYPITAWEQFFATDGSDVAI